MANSQDQAGSAPPARDQIRMARELACEVVGRSHACFVRFGKHMLGYWLRKRGVEELRTELSTARDELSALLQFWEDNVTADTARVIDEARPRGAGAVRLGNISFCTAHEACREIGRRTLMLLDGLVEPAPVGHDDADWISVYVCENLGPEADLFDASAMAAEVHTEARDAIKAIEAAEARDRGGWLTVSDAALLAGVDKGTISRAATNGDLVSNDKSGRARRIDPVSLADWKRSKWPDVARIETDAEVEAKFRRRDEQR